MFFLALSHLCKGQDSDRHKYSMQLNGYVKSLQTWNAPGDISRLNNTSIIHNRLNMQLKVSDHFYSAISFRNRLICGDDVRQIPHYKQVLRNRQELLNLSATWIDHPDLILHSNTERLWAEYRRPKWNIRVGRQRINWSMSNTWNPGDLFNVYNFLDVDYEERPGTDAIKFLYQTGDLSALEIAFAPAKHKNQDIKAIRYTFNQWETDFQFILGSYKKRISLGGGWAGHLKETGWKGEIQYYLKKGPDKDQLNITIEMDHMLKNGWYFNSGILYNSNGISGNIFSADSLRFEFTPLQLMPTKLNTILSASKEINPIISVTSSFLYSPNSNLLIVLPGIKANLGNNFDADFIWQSFFAGTEIFKAIRHSGFIRIRWSY